MPEYIMSARNVKNGGFGTEPSASRYLVVPDGEVVPLPSHATLGKGQWFDAVRTAATWGVDSRTGKPRGDVLYFVHGYNNDSAGMLARHRNIKSGLGELGFKGVIVSFDWPSDDKTLLYLDDRHDAKATAMQLVDDGVKQLARLQDATQCTINIHVLAHSMGAYVVREAFDDADDARLATQSWIISQIILLAGDVSQDSMLDDSPTSESLYRHCIRLTNYSSRYDSVLKISNAKRLGLAPRVGRVGLPAGSPSQAVNVDCSDYFQSLTTESAADYAKEQFDNADKAGISFSHSWYLANRVVMADVFKTLKGDIDRQRIPTRVVGPDGLSLQRLPTA